jgi:hypothetical protein
LTKKLKKQKTNHDEKQTQATGKPSGTIYDIWDSQPNEQDTQTNEYLPTLPKPRYVSET